VADATDVSSPRPRRILGPLSLVFPVEETGSCPPLSRFSSPPSLPPSPPPHALPSLPPPSLPLSPPSPPFHSSPPDDDRGGRGYGGGYPDRRDRSRSPPRRRSRSRSPPRYD
jgi:hypothetical protein